MDFIEGSLKPEVMRPRPRVFRIAMAVKVGREAAFGAEIPVAGPAFCANAQARLWLFDISPMDRGRAVRASQNAALVEMSAAPAIVVVEVALAISEPEFHRLPLRLARISHSKTFATGAGPFPKGPGTLLVQASG